MLYLRGINVLDDKDMQNLKLVDNLPKHIKKGHQLLFSRQDLSAREADMMALMMAYMTPKDWDNKTPDYTFPCAKLAEWLGLDARHVGTVLAPIADRLAQRKIGIEGVNKKGEIEFEHIPLFKRIQYKDSKLKIIPNDELKAEYIQYNKGFALINTENFLGLNKEYAKRFYELLSRFKDKGKMRVFSIEELQGLFGLLDENNKLKKDKQSFRSTGVFMKRCIRNSIAELMADPKTNKELLFLTSSNNEIGYETSKIGNKIVGVNFLYKWIGRTTTVDTLNRQNAEEIIDRLEVKRLKGNVKLDNKELELLGNAYKTIGQDELAFNIIESLAKRENDEKSHEIQKDSVQSLLDKINSLKEVSGDVGY